jgi:DNA-binding CsgD family transcriptional regulator
MTELAADLVGYDALLAALYRSAMEGAPLDPMLTALRQLFDGASTGITVYGHEDRIAHWLVERIEGELAGGAARYRRIFDDIYDDPGAVLLTSRWLDQPRRFTDLLAPSRLESAAWYRSQRDMANVGPGILVDVTLGELDSGGGRVRPFLLRRLDQPDFTQADLDLFGLFVRHLQRGFAGQMNRFVTAQPPESRLIRIALQPPDPASAHRRRPVETVLREAGLSPSEARVAALLSEGRSRDEVAQALGIALNTVKTHVRRVYAKLRVSRQSQLAAAIGALRSST